jgi:hypothetical protein
VDIRCRGTIFIDRPAKVIALVTSLRDTKLVPEPKELRCPDWSEIEYFTGFSKLARGKNPLAMYLEGHTKTDPLADMPCIVTRNVEQLLSVAALSDAREEEPRNVYLINSVLEDRPLVVDYEACL